MLKYILLGFLNYGAMSGYDLKSLMDESTAHFWHAYHSQIYTTLRKLEADGLVESDVIDDDESRLNRRVYTLTAAGRAELLAWLDQALMSLPQVKEDLLVRLFFSASRDPQAVLNELRLQRQLHQQKLDYYEALSSEHLLHSIEEARIPDRDVAFWRTTLDFGRRFEVMYLRWLDDTISQIESL